MKQSDWNPWDISQRVAHLVMNDVPIEVVEQTVEVWPFKSNEEVLEVYKSNKDTSHHELALELRDLITSDSSQNNTGLLSDWNTARSAAAQLIQSHKNSRLSLEEASQPLISLKQTIRTELENQNSGTEQLNEVTRFVRELSNTSFDEETELAVVLVSVFHSETRDLTEFEEEIRDLIGPFTVTELRLAMNEHVCEDMGRSILQVREYIRENRAAVKKT